MRGFHNGLIFKIWPSGSGDIRILVLQKIGFVRQNLEGTYLSEMAPKSRFLKGFFAIFWEKTLITLSKKIQNLKVRAYLMQKFMELDIKKFSDPKVLTFGVGLKN